MSTEVLVAILSFAGTLVGSFSGMKLMSYRIAQLEERVNKHNNVIERTYILEERMKESERRIEDLEKRS